MKLSSLKLEVEELMRKDYRCRSDDKWLVFKMLQKRTKIYIPHEDFEKLPSFESITRVRRYIQNTEGRLLPDKETVNKRSQNQQLFREWLKK